MKTNSLILDTDSYKLSMAVQYPPNTTGVFSYVESRGGKYDEVVFFGLQAFIRKVMLNPITQQDIDFAEMIISKHGLPFNREGWEYILKEHNGYLPVVIKALPEGTVTKTGNALVTIENTDPNCFWLTTYLETAMLRAVWYPTTVASFGRKCRKIILKYLEETGDPSLINFKLHDFGSRGVSSEESASLGGMAHLVNFDGTDTIVGILAAMEFYDSDVCGWSIPAMEHSTVTSWGREGELDAYSNMLDQYAKPGALLACVSDSYDIMKAVDMWGTDLKQKVLDSGATLVVRPDSGDPVIISLKVLMKLKEYYGSVVNNKGYHVINNVRVIWGDGITAEVIGQILFALKLNNLSADNIAFGMGGNLLQNQQRDDMKFAMKCSAAKVNGEWRDVFKDPVTDPGKKSKKGRLVVIKDSDGNLNTVAETTQNQGLSELVCIYENGREVNKTTFSDVKKRARV